MMPWEKYAAQAAQAAPEGAPAVPPWEKYGAAKQAPATGLEKLPPETGAPQNPNAAPEKADSIAQKLLGSLETGAALGTGALAGTAGQLYGIGKTLTGGKFGTPQGAQEGERAGVELANRLTYQPRTQTGQQLTEAAGKVLSPLQALPMDAALLGRLGEVPRGALAAGETAADINRGVARTAAIPAKALTRKAINALPDLDPATKDLAREAHGMGFRLTPDQVYGNKYGKFAGELAGQNPLIKNAREHNEAVGQRALVGLVGGDAPKLTRKTYAEAMDNSGKTIGDIAERTPVPVNPAFIGKLRSNAAGHTPDVAGVVNDFASQIDKAAGKPETLLGGGRKAGDRELNGTALRRINTAISKRMRETPNGDLRTALGGLQDDLLEHQSQFMSSKDRVAYNQARKFYAIGKTLEPLVAKSPTGDIPLYSLLGAINRNALGKSLTARGAAGDLGKLADIGQRFLKPLPSSGTAERAFMQNLMTHPIGAAATTGVAALTAPAAAAYNRFGPEVTQRLIDRPPVP